MITQCILCGSIKINDFYNISKIPISPNAPLKSHNQEAILANIRIVQCQICGHFFNSEFDSNLIPKIYSENYSSGLPSPSVIKKLEEILDKIIEAQRIKHQIILEIGASDLTLSNMMIDKGADRVIAFEPSNSFSNTNLKIEFNNSFFKSGLLMDDEFGLIVIRHVLEHLISPLEIVGDFHRILRKGGFLYIEVPNATDILMKFRFYDFIYEHVSYFSPESVINLLDKSGFEVCKLHYLAGNQHLGVLAKKISKRSNPKKILKTKIYSISEIEEFNNNVKSYLNTLRNIFDSTGKCAIYGAGTHAIVTASSLPASNIEFFIDLNKLKDKKFVPKLRTPIRHPDSVNFSLLDRIIIIASLHQDEIYKNLMERFEYKGEIWGTYPQVSLLNASAGSSTQHN